MLGEQCFREREIESSTITPERGPTAEGSFVDLIRNDWTVAPNVNDDHRPIDVDGEGDERLGTLVCSTAIPRQHRINSTPQITTCWGSRGKDREFAPDVRFDSNRLSAAIE